MGLKFNWKSVKRLGHKFEKTLNRPSAWVKCLNCNVVVYVCFEHFGNKLMYWENDMFHNAFEPFHNEKVVEFNLTCNEIIIKKILE